MPDLITHFSSAFLFRNFSSRFWFSKKPFFIMLLFGVCLPDIASRGAFVLFPHFFFQAQYFHSPFACFFQSIIISCFFVRKQRRQVFHAITIGWILHQVFDLLQKHVGPGNYYFFWPIYPDPISFNLIWAQYWPIIALATTSVALLTSQNMVSWIYRQLKPKSNL